MCIRYKQKNVSQKESGKGKQWTDNDNNQKTK